MAKRSSLAACGSSRPHDASVAHRRRWSALTWGRTTSTFAAEHRKQRGAVGRRAFVPAFLQIRPTALAPTSRSWTQKRLYSTLEYVFVIDKLLVSYLQALPSHPYSSS